MIKINNLMKSFNDKMIFDDVNIEFCDTGEIYCILGESGAGKSTLFQILFGLDNKYEGQYILNGVDAKQYTQNQWSDIRSSLMQIVYQDFKLLENFSVYDNLNYAMNINVENREDKINDALKKMDLTQHIYKKVNKLSGGEKQRLAFARAIINNPKLILLDEPTGNLDDKNANIIMQYISTLKKDGSMIIIITHDSRVIPYCSNILEIVDKNIITKSKNNDIIISKIDYEVISKQSKLNSFKYTTKSIKHNLSDILLNNIPVISIFIVFICCLSLLWTNSISSSDKFYNKISDSAIYVTSSNFTDEYRNSVINDKKPLMNDGTRINFSNLDLEMVENLEGVDSVTLFNGHITSTDDTNDYTCAHMIEKNNLSNITKSLPSFTRYPNTIEFEFNTLNVPKDYISDYNPKNIALLYGEYPQDESEDILIPEFLAQTFDLNIENVIGEKVNINIYEDHSKIISKDYVVSGIYESLYKNSLEDIQIIYLGFRNVVRTELDEKDSTYEMFKNDYLNYGGVLDGSLYSSKEVYLNAIGTGMSDMIIKLEDSSYNQEVSFQIQELFPNLKFMSQSKFKTGEYKSLYEAMIKLIVIACLILSVIFGSIIIFLNKSYIKRRNKEVAILYSLGYKKKNIYSILMCEYAIVTTINYIIAYVLLFGIYNLYIKYTVNYFIFEDTFTPLLICVGYFFIIIMTLFSVIFSINGIKLKKLQNHLR